MENFQKYVFASQYSFVHYTVDVIFLCMTYGYCCIRNRCTPYNLNRTTLGHVILNLKFYNAWHFKSFLAIDFMQVAIDFKHVLIKKKKLWVKLLFYLFENRIAIWNLLKLPSLLKNSPSSMVFTILFHGVFCNSLILNIWCEYLIWRKLNILFCYVLLTSIKFWWLLIPLLKLHC